MVGWAGLKATTFRAISKQHKTPEIENCALVLHNLQFRIARIREAADVNNRYAPPDRPATKEGLQAAAGPHAGGACVCDGV